jgi:hypothetical protein
VAFSHYPKIESNVIFAWVWPRPPDKDPFTASSPRFAETNLIEAPLAPGESLFGYHSVQGCTRLYDSIVSDQPMVMTYEFSNDEVGPDGSWVTDETMPLLHYDVLERETEYKPGERKGHWTLILGRWLRVTVKNVGNAPTKELRCYVRGSVF